jgi:hypothetical protein
VPLTALTALGLGQTLLGSPLVVTWLVEVGRAFLLRRHIRLQPQLQGNVAAAGSQHLIQPRVP